MCDGGGWGMKYCSVERLHVNFELGGHLGKISWLARGNIAAFLVTLQFSIK